MQKLFHQPKSVKEATTIQRNLANKLSFQDEIEHTVYIAGVDVSYSKSGGIGFGVVALFRFPELQLIEYHSSAGVVNFPYIPGYLSFREIPLILPLFRKLQKQPGIVLVDGQGIAHPRSLGIASHLGILLNLPTIGCAKTLLVGEYHDPPNDKGAYSWLIYRRRIVGAVLRSKKNVRPIIVSPGYKVSLPTAVKIVTRCITNYRLPEPIRITDQLTKNFRTTYREGS